jgi:hypothetical protein
VSSDRAALDAVLARLLAAMLVAEIRKEETATAMSRRTRIENRT